MKEIRMKQASNKPKVMDKVSRLPQNTKNVLENVRDKAKELDTRDMQGRPENYAADKVADKASDAAQKGAVEIRKRSQQIVNRGKNEVKKRFRQNAQKGTIKTVDKSVKSAKYTVKATGRTIKTSARVAKTAAKTTKATAKASVRTVRAAIKATVTAIKVLVKATIVAVKATAAAIKSLVAAIATGGWIVIVIIIVVGAILFIVNSAFGLFYSNEDDGDVNTIPMSQAVAEISGGYSIYVDQQINNALAGYENVTVVYDNGIDGDSDSVNNWVDVLGIYAIKTTMGESEPMEVATVTEEKKQILKNLYWEMNTVSIRIETIEETDPDDEDAETGEKTIVHAVISSEDYMDAAERYGFTEEQNEMLEELMVPEYHHMFIALIGIDRYGGLTAQELEEIQNSLPNDVGGDIVRYALTRLGDPYSKELRGTGSYVDCSYLVRWAYNQAGVTSYTAATAAEQARYCVNNDMLISKEQLRPGDVIFWRKNGCDCGRYKEIHHVAIYIGDGKIIEASSSRGYVVINDLWGEGSGSIWEIIYFSRPQIY
ncbi:MAG: NlpC/P60 family protein [Eubacteriales bacterium]|nr:NlpC/P60 family protein [Eubacteriales bacterium]